MPERVRGVFTTKRYTNPDIAIAVDSYTVIIIIIIIIMRTFV